MSTPTRLTSTRLPPTWLTPALRCLLPLALAALPAAAQERLWLHQFEPSGYTFTALAPDGAGGAIVLDNVYYATRLARYDADGNQLWFRPVVANDAPDVTLLVPDGAGGAYVAGYAGYEGRGDTWFARYDSAGEQMWLRRLGTIEGDQIYGIIPDGAGGVILTGTTRGALGGPFAGGYADVWLARYDGQGSQLWIRQFGSSSHEITNAAASDGAGGVYLTGWTQGALGGPFAGGLADIWLARYDADGNRAWIRQFGSSRPEYVQALSGDGAGGVFLGGRTYGDLAGPYISQGDTWLARYDGAGTQTWVRQIGTDGRDEPLAIVPAGDGAFFVAGRTDGALGGPAAGVWDAWLARYDAGGTQMWLRQFGSASDDLVNSLIPDGAGGVVSGGQTFGALAGPATGSSDAWFARHDSAGDRVWIRQFGTEVDDAINVLLPDGAGGIFACGYTYGSLGEPPVGDGGTWIARYNIEPTCPADWDISGIVNSSDISAFLTAWLTAVTDGTLDADINSDGVTDSSDISAFLTLWLDGVTNGC